MQELWARLVGEPLAGRHLTALTLMFALLSGALLSWHLVRQDADARRRSAEGTVREWAANLQVELRHSLSVLDVMATVVRQADGSIGRFQELAPHFFTNYPAVLDLEMQKDGIIHDVYPREGNEGAIGVNLWESDADVPLLKVIRDTGELTVQGPIKLFQGPFEGLVARKPLYFDRPGEPRSFWGFVTAIVRIDKLVERAGFADLAKAGFHYELRGAYSATGKERVIARSGEAPLADTVSGAVHLPGGNWALHVEPVGGWTRPVLALWCLGLTVLFSALMTALVRFSREVRLGALRTDILNRDLAAEHERLAAARDEAEAANRAKSEFLSRMSHELRTPLNAVLGFSKLLEMIDLPERGRGNVKRILVAGQHLLELIDEALDISRIEAGRLSLASEEVDVDALIREVVDLVEPLGRQRGIAVVHERASDPDLRASADRQRLRQILLNLASNAIKYNRDGGAATLAAGVTEADRVRVEVRDTGPGIPEEKRARLFTPFDRLDAERERSEVEGTGLGLALSKKLAEAMGGAISMESGSGEGAVFAVELDRAAGAGRGGSRRPARSDDASHRRQSG